MPQQLPPLNALRAFEAVARHLSFTKAAAELNVTRAAISHQIKYLEDFLGFALLERKNKSIILTKRADAALPKLRLGFDALAEAVHLMRGEQQAESITVWVAPSFASKWLVPRLRRFSHLHPEINMLINSSTDLVDADAQAGSGSMEVFFRPREVDVMIRFGAGQYSGGTVEKLFAVSAVPLCSPALVSDAHPHPLRTPQDLAFHTLLHDETAYAGNPSWDAWLARQGVGGINTSRGVHFNHVALAIDAAIEGQGVLLSMKPLAKFDLDAGKLCIPFGFELPLEYAYYVIYPEKSGFNQRAIEVFVQWLREEVRAG